MKVCRKCREELPIVAFTRNNSFPDGKSTWCAQCRSKYRREEYAEHHPERKRAQSESTVVRKTKVCIDCVKELPIGRFHRKRDAADKHTSYCKECGNARSIKWQRDNKDRIASKRLKDRQKSPRWSLNVNLRCALARHATENPATLDDLMALWNQQDGKCALSSIQMTWAQGKILPTSITLDRISHDDGYSIENIRLVCHAINSFRGRMTDDEMFDMAEALIAYRKRPKLKLVS